MSKNKNPIALRNPFVDGYFYLIDRTQRSVLFFDALRKRGDQYIQHKQDGQPPVLKFDYETVLDGHTLDNPVNYSLLRILSNTVTNTSLRPIVIFDPRAGHGPGIGGSKTMSQVGIALRYGHPVYFVSFAMHPTEKQTTPKVLDAWRIFLEKVRELHPDVQKPATIGNCQAGWALSMLDSMYPELMGPMSLNGTPLSFWGGKFGSNPMRYKGLLPGGTWLGSLVSDLCSTFDGAYVVSNFENLNVSNTAITKLRHLFENIDTEEDRFLNFEKWWGGFFTMTPDEINFISNLFVDNPLENGNLVIDDKIVAPAKPDALIILTSKGDNISPPEMALGGILATYKNDAEIDRPIIYCILEDPGHLAIFVSRKVCEENHSVIIGGLEEMWENLPPGLYELRFPHEGNFPFTLEERCLEDIRIICGSDAHDRKAFTRASETSKMLDDAYKMFSPLVKMFRPPKKLMEVSHPLRVQRYAFASINNPLAAAYLQHSADMIREDAVRQKTDDENPFIVMEKAMITTAENYIDMCTNMMDALLSLTAKMIYRI